MSKDKGLKQGTPTAGATPDPVKLPETVDDLQAEALRLTGLLYQELNTAYRGYKSAGALPIEKELDVICDDVGLSIESAESIIPKLREVRDKLKEKKTS